MIPSRELTYPIKNHLWRWFSFSQGGMCIHSLQNTLIQMCFFFGYRVFLHRRHRCLLPFRQQRLRAGVAWIVVLGVQVCPIGKGLNLHSYFSGWEWVWILREGKCIKKMYGWYGFEQNMYYIVFACVSGIILLVTYCFDRNPWNGETERLGETERIEGLTRTNKALVKGNRKSIQLNLYLWCGQIWGGQQGLHDFDLLKN